MVQISTRVSLTATQDRELLESLRIAARKRRGLSALLGFHRAVLKQQLAIKEGMSPSPPPSLSTIAERLSVGAAALAFSDLGVDGSRLDRLCPRLARVMARYRPGFDPGQVAHINWHAAAESWYQSRSGLTLASDPDRGAVAGLIAGYGLAPFLDLAASTVAAALQQTPWWRGYCPACGGAPDFGVLGERGERLLLCGRCPTLWAYERVGCPFCGESRSGRLSCFVVAEGRYRLNLCSSCHRYIKTIDVRKATDELSLPLERLVTAGLDLAADHAGYVAA